MHTIGGNAWKRREISLAWRKLRMLTTFESNVGRTKMKKGSRLYRRLNSIKRCVDDELTLNANKKKPFREYTIYCLILCTPFLQLIFIMPAIFSLVSFVPIQFVSSARFFIIFHLIVSIPHSSLESLLSQNDITQRIGSERVKNDL